MARVLYRGSQALLAFDPGAVISASTTKWWAGVT
jgi:hypothetical protein